LKLFVDDQEINQMIQMLIDVNSKFQVNIFNKKKFKSQILNLQGPFDDFRVKNLKSPDN